MRPWYSGLSTTLRHASVFTRRSELLRNRQALFRFQSTETSVPALSRLLLNIQQLSRQGLKPVETSLTAWVKTTTACGGF
jgi:hypothetical protein